MVGTKSSFETLLGVAGTKAGAMVSLQADAALVRSFPIPLVICGDESSRPGI